MFLKKCRTKLSNFCTMLENFTPTLVYKRKKHRENTAAIFTAHPSNGKNPNNGCHSNGYYAGNEDVLTIDGDRVLNTISAIDNSSSSVSNSELHSASLKLDTVDGGDSSSSGASISEKGLEGIPETDICISILRSQGLLGKASNRNRASTRSTNLTSDCYCLMPCRVCERVETTLHMLVCDNCEDAFHLSCYNPHMMILPKREWLCSSCFKKKHKILTGNSVDVSSKIDRKQYATSEGELGSLEFMFADTEPYMSNVRIGDEFQADVPEWRGPINEHYDDLVGNPSEPSPSNNTGIEDCIKPLKLGSIGNWIQCRGVVEGINDNVDGTICGKWRRAPLFEVQTDDWECFRCILWDPARADCAVPQELDTEEVMRQLKYIEMLRPRLAAKKRKLERSKRASSSSVVPKILDV